MNRTSSYKLLYLIVVAAALAAAVAIAIHFGLGTPGIVIMALLLFVPGRIGGHFLKDLFRGRHYVTTREHEKAIAASERFLDVLDRQPWRQHFVYCFFGIYTWNTRAMALNNIGAANMELGHLGEAETLLLQALELDEHYPIPFHNLAIIAAVRGDRERSDEMSANARQRGYSQSLSDEVISRVSAAYAQVQAIGI